MGDAGAIASLVALHMVLLWRAAILRGFLMHNDLIYFFEPAKALLHESLRAGRLPLWSPYVLCGYPFAAEGQIQAFYPVSLLISWLLPAPAAINWFVISHLLLAAISMYLLARQMGMSRFSAWLAALTFSFSGFIFARIQHLSILGVYAWLPLVIFFVERAWRSALVPNAALAAAAWAASALCGHPQGLFFTSLITVFWVVWRWVGGERTGRSYQFWGGVRLLAIVFGLGAGLAAVQLLLTLDLARAGPPGKAGDLAWIAMYPLLVKHLVGLVAPNWQGSIAFDTYTGEDYYWGYVLYIGLIPLALALIGSGRRTNWAIAGLAIGGLVLALGPHNPVHHVIRFLPGFAHFRAPCRYLFIFTFGAALLVGCGWHVIAGRPWLARGRRLVVLGSVVAVLSAFDLIWFDRGLAPLASPRAYSAPSAVAESLQADPGWWRALVVPPMRLDAGWVPRGGWLGNPDGWQEARVLLPLNVPQSYHVRVSAGYQRFPNPDQTAFFDAAYASVHDADLAMLSLLGVKYLAFPAGFDVPGFPSRRAGPFVVYSNDQAFPRVFAVPQVIHASSSPEALSRTVELARGGELAEIAVVQGEMGSLQPSGSPVEKLAIEEPRPERVIVHTRSRQDCLLVLNERYDQGWRVRLDGRPVPLLTVDTVLMGALLPGGEHTVEFLYQPRGLVIGRVISLLSLMVCAALVAGPRLRSRWPKAYDWQSRRGLITPSRVRIPPPPPRRLRHADRR
ncbi:MAG: YfhO family protein [Proteobacteria bacterium]|nr:YfhO family protein [Pseudomonadota bacterium]